MIKQHVLSIVCNERIYVDYTYLRRLATFKLVDDIHAALAPSGLSLHNTIVDISTCIATGRANKCSL